MSSVRAKQAERVRKSAQAPPILRFVRRHERPARKTPTSTSISRSVRVSVFKKATVIVEFTAQHDDPLSSSERVGGFVAGSRFRPCSILDPQELFSSPLFFSKKVVVGLRAVKVACRVL